MLCGPDVTEELSPGGDRGDHEVGTDGDRLELGGAAVERKPYVTAPEQRRGHVSLAIDLDFAADIGQDLVPPVGDQDAGAKCLRQGNCNSRHAIACEEDLCQTVMDFLRSLKAVEMGLGLRPRRGRRLRGRDRRFV